MDLDWEEAAIVDDEEPESTREKLFPNATFVPPTTASGSDSPLLTEYSPVIILHIHGGGWISQSPRTHLAYLRIWARETKLPILSVDYGKKEQHRYLDLESYKQLGLSPENEFPGALNECYAAYKWLLDPDNAQAIGMAAFEIPPRIILTGDSAGGNLCAALTIRVC